MTVGESDFPTQIIDVNASLKTITSTIVAGVQYIGNAKPGVATSSAEWRIFRVTTSGDEVKTEFAGGTARFINIWDDRAGYSYS